MMRGSERDMIAARVSSDHLDHLQIEWMHDCDEYIEHHPSTIVRYAFTFVLQDSGEREKKCKKNADSRI